MAQTVSPNSLLQLLSTNPQTLLQPTTDYNNAALALAKFYLDPLAQQVSEVQNQRQKEFRRKRKRGEREEGSSAPLQLKKIHVEGFKVDQVHEQVKRVLNAARGEVELGLETLQDELENTFTNGTSGEQARLEDGESEDEDENELNEDDLSPLEDNGYHTDESDQAEAQLDENDEEDEEDEDEADATGDEDIMQDEDRDDSLQEDAIGGADTFVEDVHGLNDGFFSIDDFNRQTDLLEQVDARGDPDDGAASDEEEVDWTMDPTSKINLGGAQNNEEEDSDEEDEEGGPTFGNMDINAPEGFSDDENMDGEDEDIDMDAMGLSNTNDIKYKDFFAPPARKGHRAGKHGAPMKHNFPEGYVKPAPQPEEPDIARTMAAVHRDLFSDDEEAGADDEEGAELDRSDPQSRYSAHERRQAKILSEIRRLEAENVAKRRWTLTGEARAADRPHNSLLGEDLDFERVGKPVPVITQEVSEDIEALIKRRIVAREFDEILRRQPDELLTGRLGRRGRLDEEIADTKSKKGLGELYEEEHLKKTDANYVDARTEKKKAEHLEIENLWKDVSDKLDSLSSWHYRPRPVEMSVQVRTDAPLISMEDARPNGIGGEMSEMTQLAPQEIYKPGQDKDRDEIVTKGGEVVAQEELTREQRKKRRQREKERARKAGENGNRANPAPGKTAKKGTKKDKNEILGDLKKGGVMVIGRKGEVVDVEGKEKQDRKTASAGALRL